MKIAVLKERAQTEARIAVTPEVVSKYIKHGIEIYIESGAGDKSSFTDEDFVNAGAKVSKIPLEIIADADIILKVQPTPLVKNGTEKGPDEYSLAKDGATVIGILSPHDNQKIFSYYNKKKLTTLSMEFMPRITRAQSMDVLSSQSNLSGYRAVIDAVYELERVFPMMITSAGTINPTKVLVIGAGVAGLQAIATAKRLGALVSAFDVRSATKEQVESLGAKFVNVKSDEDGSGSGGYAKEMSAKYRKNQADLLSEQIRKHNVIITTAQIPNKPAPKLIDKNMVESMASGSVIVDLAASTGGNCVLTKLNHVIKHKNVKIIGYSNYPSRAASSASKLYANNIFNLINYLYNKETRKINLDFSDEIVQNIIITHNGQFIHKDFD